MGLRSSKYPWKIEKEKMLEKPNNLCPNAYLSQRLFLLRIKSFCQAYKTQNILLWHFQKEYFWINNFTIIVWSRNNWIEKVWREPFFLVQNRMNCFFFHHKLWNMISFGFETHSLWNHAGFFPSLPCPHGTLEPFARLLTSVLHFVSPNWPRLLGKCCQRKEQWRLAPACVTSPSPSKTEMEIPGGSQLVLDAQVT